ncbi:MAG: 30S ribosome-binding factor RbfA [Lentisphaerae bacterium]|jgi:ribosome-binding factor A|nr:30S ribosome-binding factor RbfA [Lentisphaerota bacterium]
MAVDRLERVNALLRRAIGEALFQVFNNEIELAAITVTSVEASRNLRHAKVGVSIMGHEEERGRFMRALADKSGELQAIINKSCHLKYTPRLRFVHDTSIEKGDHVLALLNSMEESGELANE